MLKKMTPVFVLVLAFACAGTALAADPTRHEIYQAAESGRIDQAQLMVQQVLRDHPTSAQAHYVAAEVYARAGNYSLASQELNTAQRLKPGLPDENPSAVLKLERQLAQAQGGRSIRVVPASQPTRSAFPWGMVVILLVGVGILIAVMVRRSRQVAVYQQYPGAPGMGMPGPMGGPVMGPGPVMTPGMGAPGSGIMGSLATGLAVGAGVAAGEELVRHVFDGDRHSGGFIPSAGASEPPDNPNADMGGTDFGTPDSGSWDDNSGGGGGGGDDWT